MRNPSQDIEEELIEKMLILEISINGALYEMDTFGSGSDHGDGLLYSFWNLREALEEYRERCRET